MKFNYIYNEKMKTCHLLSNNNKRLCGCDVKKIRGIARIFGGEVPYGARWCDESKRALESEFKKWERLAT